MKSYSYSVNNIHLDNLRDYYSCCMITVIIVTTENKLRKMHIYLAFL